MKTSCGVIIVNELNEIFMAHSTGNKFFDIPKGLLDEGEEPINCAIRECLEETSIIIEKDNLVDLGVFAYNKEKNLHLFFYPVEKMSIELDKLVCNSFFEDFYTKKQKPEADGFEWMNIAEVEPHCAKSMAKLLTKIKEANILPLNDLKKKIEIKL